MQTPRKVPQDERARAIVGASNGVAKAGVERSTPLPGPVSGLDRTRLFLPR